jgi:FkbM family methyltransferase
MDLIEVKQKFLLFMKSLRRHWMAIVDSLLPNRYYSQFGEDRFLADDISVEERFSGVYIDIGGNHPSRISNTYHFYRLGSSGVLVEPNPIFDRLYRCYRPRDVHLKIGIGSQPGLMPFYDNGSTSVSGFIPASAKLPPQAFFPILPLDSLLSILDSKAVYLLSIDVEGMDADVLLSGPKLLQRVRRVIVEFGENFEKIDEFLSRHGFTMVIETRLTGFIKR